ncbi:uncharacterized protein APUU_80380A [Aspergillus puulaauensis]|uniref:Uncharacterized protein n=1 Tax=Aspergillus puulaauensis TaxID=1220207 RepID=A0A7R7XYY4_9EURO|nr:uncharacterized protein APUU_80380A [Aspergillus puulaauensis]BCS30077.1 hypothetical protein APUU_80380A [Aspergillus puulaauensis]
MGPIWLYRMIVWSAPLWTGESRTPQTDSFISLESQASDDVNIPCRKDHRLFTFTIPAAQGAKQILTDVYLANSRVSSPLDRRRLSFVSTPALPALASTILYDAGG